MRYYLIVLLAIFSCQSAHDSGRSPAPQQTDKIQIQEQFIEQPDKTQEMVGEQTEKGDEESVETEKASEESVETETFVAHTSSGPGKEPEKENAESSDKNEGREGGAWEEYSEEDLAVEFVLDQAIITVTRALKVGQVRAEAMRQPLCLIFTKDEQQRCEIGLYRMLSQPGVTPIEVGERLEYYQLPEGVVFPESRRYFWYDADGNIAFAEPDKILQPFDPTPDGDIILLPLYLNNPRMGVIDIGKRHTLLQAGQYIIQTNRP